MKNAPDSAPRNTAKVPGPHPHPPDTHPPDTRLRCPVGHGGPFRYVEHIEAWRDVGTLRGNVLPVSGHYETGEGYDDGIPGTAYLECHFSQHPGGLCLERFELPVDVEVDWVAPNELA